MKTRRYSRAVITTEELPSWRQPRAFVRTSELCLGSLRQRVRLSYAAAPSVAYDIASRISNPPATYSNTAGRQPGHARASQQHTSQHPGARRRDHFLLDLQDLKVHSGSGSGLASTNTTGPLSLESNKVSHCTPITLACRALEGYAPIPA